MKNTTITILLLFLSSTMVNAKEPYYGFYPSDSGQNYKIFRHNIYNFEVELPKNWTFGVAGNVPVQVILMYQETLDTSTFSPTYNTVSVGLIPNKITTLDQAYQTTLLGMKNGHKEFNILRERKKIQINKNKTICFVFSWQSKTGKIIVESIYFIKSLDKIYTLNVRTIDPISNKLKSIHKKIIGSFKPIKPIEFK